MVKSFKADVRTNDKGLILRSDEGLTLETLALKHFTVANLRYQLS